MRFSSKFNAVGTRVKETVLDITVRSCCMSTAPTRLHACGELRLGAEENAKRKRACSPASPRIAHRGTQGHHPVGGKSYDEGRGDTPPRGIVRASPMTKGEESAPVKLSELVGN